MAKNTKKKNTPRNVGLLEALRDHQLCRAATIPSGKTKELAKLRREKISRHAHWE
jgi:hypothetical protein